MMTMTKMEVLKKKIVNKSNRNCNHLLTFFKYISEKQIESEKHDSKLESGIK